jgi:hypothetical protein
MVGPSSKAKQKSRKPASFVPHPDDAADVQAGLDEASRGEGVSLTPEQVDRWAETGELPEPVEQWAESSSRRDT